MNVVDSLAVIVDAFRSRDVIWIGAVAPLGWILFNLVRQKPLPASRRRWIRRISILMAIGFLLIDARYVTTNFTQTRDWDFCHFWIFGVAVSESTSPYDHENLLRISEPLEPSESVKRELFCYYPPPSLLLFAPLGWFSFYSAMGLWYAIQTAALIASIFLLTRVYSEGRTIDSVTFMSVLVLAFRPVATTYLFAQANFLVLFLLLLFWFDREKAMGGLWLALGVLVKPVVIAIPLYLLMRGRWKSIFVLAGTLVVFFILSLFIVGESVFMEFFRDNAVPGTYKMTQTINQSLTAVMLRAVESAPEDVSSGFQAILIAAIAIVVVITAIFIFRMKNAGDKSAVAMTISMAVMIYPATLTHYGTVLLLPIVHFLSETARRENRIHLEILVVLFGFFLAALELTFWAMLLLWIANGLQGLSVERKQRERQMDLVKG